jgi:hypothetical protein
MQVDPIKPTLKLPGTNLLTLKYDKSLSTVAFKINLRHFNKELRRIFHHLHNVNCQRADRMTMVGRCRLTL